MRQHFLYDLNKKYEIMKYFRLKLFSKYILVILNLQLSNPSHSNVIKHSFVKSFEGIKKFYIKETQCKNKIT